MCPHANMQMHTKVTRIYVRSLSNRAHVYLQQGEFALAEADCTAALDANPAWAKARHRRGVARSNMGRSAHMHTFPYTHVDVGVCLDVRNLVYVHTHTHTHTHTRKAEFMVNVGVCQVRGGSGRP